MGPKLCIGWLCTVSDGAMGAPAFHEFVRCQLLGVRSARRFWYGRRRRSFS